MKIKYELMPKNKQQKLPQDQSKLGFGQLRTNHMFLANYSEGKWHSARIVPYGPLPLAPGTMALHYAQSIFEGTKAFMHEDGEIYLFRYDKNISRLNISAEVLSMPALPEDLHREAVKKLIDLERDWCPSIPQSSLYIRPFIFASSDMLGATASKEYIFCIILSPSGPYYSGGFEETVSLMVSEKYHRAVIGGTGKAKASGNYAASLRAVQDALNKGCSQVLYLDPKNQYVEEIGSMNHYHVLKDGTFIIPEFTETILCSITSLSILELAEMGKIKARQEKIPLKELVKGIKNGDIIEAGGFGTACVVSPVGKYLFDNGEELLIGNGKPGKYSTELFKLYSEMQTGMTPAPEGWLEKVPRYKKQ